MKRLINRLLYPEKKIDFSGDYLCKHVEDYCNKIYANGKHKDVNLKLTDQMVSNYHRAIPYPKHDFINGKIICNYDKSE
jgi:hypothetical protein